MPRSPHRRALQGRGGAQCDAVVILGSDYTDVGSPTELAYNARIAANLGAPVLLVIGGRVGERAEAHSPAEMAQLAEMAIAELRERATPPCWRSSPTARTRRPWTTSSPPSVLRCRPPASETIELSPPAPAEAEAAAVVPVWAIPEDPVLVAPTMRAIMDATGGTLHAPATRSCCRARRLASSSPRCRWKTCCPG